jgi:hypothetical protein
VHGIPRPSSQNGPESDICVHVHDHDLQPGVNCALNVVLIESETEEVVHNHPHYALMLPESVERMKPSLNWFMTTTIVSIAEESLQGRREQ